jgi:beta-glucosidase-like glycosyl hydrolase
LDGRISKERIDDAVARVLRAKFELGLFENPYVSNKDIEELKKSITNHWRKKQRQNLLFCFRIIIRPSDFRKI